MKLTVNSQVSLDGEGGICIICDPKENHSKCCTNQMLYKPKSLQGLWSLHIILNRIIIQIGSMSKSNPQSLDTAAITTKKVNSPRHLINQWEFDQDLWSKRPDRLID